MRQREKQRKRETDRQTKRATERERDRQTDKEGDRERETNRGVFECHGRWKFRLNFWTRSCMLITDGGTPVPKPVLAVNFLWRIRLRKNRPPPPIGFWFRPAAAAMTLAALMVGGNISGVIVVVFTAWCWSCARPSLPDPERTCSRTTAFNLERPLGSYIQALLKHLTKVSSVVFIAEQIFTQKTFITDWGAL